MDRIWSLEFVFLPSSEKLAGVRVGVLFFCLFSWFFSLAAARLDIISGKYTNYQVISQTGLFCLVFSGCIWIIELTFCCSQYIAWSLLLYIYLPFSSKIEYRHDLKIQFCEMLGTMLVWSFSCRPHNWKQMVAWKIKPFWFFFWSKTEEWDGGLVAASFSLGVRNIHTPLWHFILSYRSHYNERVCGKACDVYIRQDWFKYSDRIFGLFSAVLISSIKSVVPQL